MSADTATASNAGVERIDDPTDLTWDDYKAALRATKDEIRRDDVPSMAAGVAFKIFLALFPSLLAAVAIFSLVTDPGRLERIIDQLAGVVPSDALSVLQGALENIVDTQAGAATGVLVTGVLGGLWAATSAAATLVKALNRAYEVPESRNAIKQRLIALALTIALLLAIGALIALVIAGPQVQSAVVPEQLQGPVASLAFSALQGLLALGVLALLFAFVYWLAPNRELPKWVWMSPGAVVGVIGWLVVSLGFTLYVQNFGNYDNATYGALGGVIVLMLWLQLSMTLLLIGGEFNAEVERIKAQYQDLRTGAGMGGVGQTADAVEIDDASLLAASPMALGQAPRAASAALARADDAEGGEAPPAPASAPTGERWSGGVRASGAHAAPRHEGAGQRRGVTATSSIPWRRSAGRGQHRRADDPEVIAGRTLLAGAAALVAAAVAVIGVVRSRD